MSSIGNYYDNKVLINGRSALSGDYGSEISREVKLIKIFRILDGLNANNVLDVGCGTGKLAEILAVINPNVSYVGIDLSVEAIKFAKNNINQQGFQFLQVDVLNYHSTEAFDLVIALGIFYLLEKDYSILENYLKKLFSLGKNVLVTTKSSLLEADNTSVGDGNSEFHINPSKLLSIASKITPYFVLYHDYHDSDLALLMRHGKSF